MKDFIFAAFPWIIMGLAIAVLAANAFVSKKGKGGKSFIAEGMYAGMAIGAVLGLFKVISPAYSISICTLVGMAAGSLIKR